MEHTAMLTGQATPEKIEAWKQEILKKHGENCRLHAYQVDDKICYLRSVDRNTYSAAAAKVTSSPAKFNETVIANIWMGGDEEIRTNDRYYLGLIDFVEELMAKKKGILIEL